jgi:hypothetical protein
MDISPMTSVSITNGRTGSRLSLLITERIAALQGEKNLARIARESGFLNPELIAQFAAGELNVPIDKLLPMAKSLGVDPTQMLVLGLEQFWSDAEALVREAFPRTVSRNEYEIVALVRDATDEGDPKLTTSQQNALRGLLREQGARH